MTQLVNTDSCSVIGWIHRLDLFAYLLHSQQEPDLSGGMHLSTLYRLPYHSVICIIIIIILPFIPFGFTLMILLLLLLLLLYPQ